MKSTRKQEKQMKQHITSSHALNSSTSIDSTENNKLILQIIKKQKKKDRQYKTHSSSSTHEKASSDTLSKQHVEASQASQQLMISFDKHLQTMINNMKQVFSCHAEE